MGGWTIRGPQTCLILRYFPMQSIKTTTKQAYLDRMVYFQQRGQATAEPCGRRHSHTPPRGELSFIPFYVSASYSHPEWRKPLFQKLAVGYPVRAELPHVWGAPCGSQRAGSAARVAERGLTWTDRRCLRTPEGSRRPAALSRGKWRRCPVSGGCQSLQKTLPWPSYHPAKCWTSNLKRVKWIHVVQITHTTFPRGESRAFPLPVGEATISLESAQYFPLFANTPSHSKPCLRTQVIHSVGFFWRSDDLRTLTLPFYNPQFLQGQTRTSHCHRRKVILKTGSSRQMIKQHNGVFSPISLLLSSCPTSNSDWKTMWIKSCLRKGNTIKYKHLHLCRCSMCPMIYKQPGCYPSFVVADILLINLSSTFSLYELVLSPEGFSPD